jgi:acyl carrier protein
MELTADSLRLFLVDTVGVDAAVVDEETILFSSGLVDSFSMLELITFIEETYGITVDDAEMLPENFDSLANIDGYVARKRAAVQAA